MRGPLIAKDDPPCGAGSRFPRAPTTTKRCNPLRGDKRGRERDRTNFSRGQIDCLSIWTHQDGNI